MCTGRRQVDVPHTVTSHLGLGHFNAALFADHATVLQALVLAAKAFIVFNGAKNLGAKQTVALWLESTVVNGLGFFDFTKRPRADLFRRGHADFDGIKMLIGRDLFKQVE